MSEGWPWPKRRRYSHVGHDDGRGGKGRGGGDGREPVVGALLEYARELQSQHAAQEGTRFTDIPAANRLIENDPNAFLVGVLFTQGVPAERAWAGPYLLGQRLGSGPELDRLDLAAVAAMDFEALAGLFAAKPALHRFKREMARYVQAAARRILEEYAGDASRMWSDAPSARELQERLAAFDGIGQKKAAMTVELLARHFGVRVSDPSGSDVAGDVHVRRVMYRTGLSESDDAKAAIEAARRVHPEHPGALDLACWLIGRHWCHPSGPNHEECRLGHACPRVGLQG